MAIKTDFGNNATSNINLALAADRTYVSKFTLTESSIKVVNFQVLAQRISIGDRFNGFKGVLYADNAGVPGDLIAETYGRDTSIDLTTSNAWFYMDFTTNPIISAGDYWIGVQTEGTINLRCVDNTGISYINHQLYANDPADPFGTPEDSYANEGVYLIGYVYGDDFSVTKALSSSVLYPEDTRLDKSVAYAVCALREYRVFKSVGYAVMEEQIVATRVTQQYAEVAGHPDPPDARITQQYGEAIIKLDPPHAYMTQQYLEVAYLGELSTGRRKPMTFIIT